MRQLKKTTFVVIGAWLESFFTSDSSFEAFQPYSYILCTNCMSLSFFAETSFYLQIQRLYSYNSGLLVFLPVETEGAHLDQEL